MNDEQVTGIQSQVNIVQIPQQPNLIPMFDQEWEQIFSCQLITQFSAK